MRVVLALAVTAVVTATSVAQADFECYPVGRFPLPGPISCENVLCNNLGLTGLTGITNASACGMPTSGSQYARIEASGPFSVPFGGPPSYPLPTNVTELRVAIPTGSTSVSFCWDFYNSEGFSSTFNDGAAIAVVDATGNLVTSLVYADATAISGPCSDFTGFFATEIGQPGPQGYTFALPTLAGGEYLSFCCWNGSDNFNPSHCKLDDVKFTGAPSCPPIPPPPANDDCAAAIAVTLGANGPFSTISATNSAGASASCSFGTDVADVWFSFVAPCAGTYDIDTCGSDYNTIVSVYDACGGIEVGCNDDDFSLPCITTFVESRVQIVVASAATPYWIRVAGNSSFGGAVGNLTLNVSRQMAFSFTTAGFGTVGYQITGGPPGGLFFTAITLNAGNFPFGSFFGVDISLQELASLFVLGYPFTGPLTGCGDAAFGPVAGVPSGLALYGTALGFNGPAYDIPSAIAVAPASVVVP